MTPGAALAAISAHRDAARAAGAKAYHKTDRVFLGVPNPVLNDLAKRWRTDFETDTRIALADALWQMDIHETRLAAAKLLTQARIRPSDEEAWRLITSWVPDFDSWAIADHASIAGQRRLVAEPDRLDEVERWTVSPHLWTKRSALVMTLPWTKQNHPKPEDLVIRDRVLTWMAGYVPDRNWFIQKAIAWWLRELSKHDPDRTSRFLQEHADQMKPFAVKEARKYL